MRIAFRGFNLVLVLVLLALSMTADDVSAADSKKKEKKPKQVKTLRIYVEARRDIPERTLTATLGPSIQFQVEKLPILNEEQLIGAALTDAPGGYQIQLRFNTVGARVLESYTAAAVGRRLAILTDIDDAARWIATPLIRQRLGDGVLRFSPAIPREEAERVAQGLAQVVEKNRKQWKWFND